ncbi:hypothetical protein GN330_12675 [Nitratireductor sp. CAU 1489]|uniref:Anti-sigma K factor RskA C-terminal domain-containing protein n=1 Tax=Nitratireductor arenosus TaxID=2682096 RepID=A0A844QG67_9HYPH|nr:anti-sigma factor [Nitratireductor arenosus]MVA98097.1 hypothetical protein [Nitratireductor arenosus]
MTSDSDRMARAGDFVMGRMNEAERERAEKDLERDPAFRDAVMRFAQRLRGPAADGARPRGDVWRAVHANIADLPQMRAASPAGFVPAEAPPGPGASAHALGGWRGVAVATCLAAAFGIGLVAGRMADATDDRRALAMLDDMAGAPRALVESFADGTLVFQPLTLSELPADTVLRLWAISEAPERAVALGRVAVSGATRLQAPTGGTAEAVRAYRLTLENAAGGSSETALAEGPRNRIVPGR